MPYDNPPTRIDLSTVDMIRDRERGVPRINNIRRSLGLPAFKSWEDLNPDPEVIAQMKSVYKSVEDVDCLVGMAAEMVSDTIYSPRIFDADTQIIYSLPLFSPVLLVGLSEIPLLQSSWLWLLAD